MSIEEKLNVILYELSVIRKEIENLKAKQNTDRLIRNRIIKTAVMIWEKTDNKNRS